jgi:hypothetical protein
MEGKMDKTKLSSTVTVAKYRNMVNDQDKNGIRGINQKVSKIS